MKTGWYRPIPVLWDVFGFLSRDVWCRFRYRTYIERHGDIPRGPVLVCAKHCKGADIPIIGVVSRRARGVIPFFQMGSFIGYRVFGALRPIFQRLGAFPVVRPKEALRLRKRKGWSKERAIAMMHEVNAAAEDVRRTVLRKGGTLIVFPEGTRDATQVLPLKSDLEVRSALALRAEGVTTQVWPVVVSYGPPRWWRRQVLLEFRPAFTLSSDDPAPVLDRLAQIFVEHWVPPEKVVEAVATRRSARRRPSRDQS